MIKTLISDVDLEELRRLWLKDQRRIFLIIDYLREKFGIKKTFGWDRLILYGRPSDNEIHEEIIGFLIAIIPGVVILDTGEDKVFRPLSGLLHRIYPPNIQLFGIKSFSPSHFSDSLYFWPSKKRKMERFKTCPVYVNWEIGAGMGSGYGYTGIDSARWEIMNQWFDKWLPKSK